MKKIYILSYFFALLNIFVLGQTPSIVKDINVGSNGSMQGSRLDYLTNFNNQLYFGSYNGLFKSNGSDVGTILVSSTDGKANGADRSYKYTRFNNELYFWRWEFPEGNSALWKTDGTTLGTIKIKTIITGSSNNQIESMVVSKGILFFTLPTQTNGKELWKSDGTDAGTVIVKDINTGTANSIIKSDLIDFNNRLYFSANNGTNGMELWTSDGTEAGTTLLKDINIGAGHSNPTSFQILNGFLYFFTYNSLWKTDGTETGTILVKNNIYQYVQITGQQPIKVNNIIYFNVVTPQNTNGELWKSDGTEAGTVLVKDINVGLGTSDFQNLTNVNGTIFFAATNGINGKELWKTDGTSAGTVMVKDINVGTVSGISSSQQSFYNYNGTLYFSANNGINGFELWKSDGTEAGTVMVTDINPGSGSSTPDGFESVNDKLFFSADNGVNGRELWKMNLVPEPEVFINSNPILSNFAGQGEPNVPFYIFSLESKNAGSILSQINLRTAGSYQQSDILNFKLFKNSIPNLIGAQQISNLTPTMGVPEVLNFVINENLTANTPVYFIATADISPNAYLSPSPNELETNAFVKSTIAANPLTLFFSGNEPSIVDNQPYNQNIPFEQKYELTKGFYIKNPQFTIDGSASTTTISSKAYISLVQNGAVFETVEIINGSYDLGSVYDGIYDLVLHKTAFGSTTPQLPNGFTSFTAERFGTGPADAIADGKFRIQIIGDYITSARKKSNESVIFELAASPLPLNLLSFSGKSTENQIQLTWRTTKEINFSHFEIQKSNNGKEFGTIGNVNSNESGFYNFIDTNPNEGPNYYKLKMIDLDGTSTFSKTISINFEKNGYYLSVENPAKNGEFMVRSNYTNPSFTLLTSFGQKIAISVTELSDYQHKIEAKTINAGIYFLMIESEGEMLTRKVLFY